MKCDQRWKPESEGPYVVHLNASRIHTEFETWLGLVTCLEKCDLVNLCILVLKRAAEWPETLSLNHLMMVQMIMSGTVQMIHDMSRCTRGHAVFAASFLFRLQGIPCQRHYLSVRMLLRVSPVCSISDRQRETHLLSRGMCQNGFLTEEASQLVSPLRPIT